DTIYFHDAQGVYVNLFIASELNWPEKKNGPVRETSFPEETGTRLTIKASAQTQWPRTVRVRTWVNRGSAVRVNGKPQDISLTPGTYVTLDRMWKDGDKVELSLPMSLHVAAIPDDHALQAMMYGPLVLAGRLGTAGLTKDLVYGRSAPDGKKTVPIPEITVSGADSTAWVEPVKDERLVFRTVGQSENVNLIPLYKLFNERYTVYWKVHG